MDDNQSPALSFSLDITDVTGTQSESDDDSSMIDEVVTRKKKYQRIMLMIKTILTTFCTEHIST